MRISKEKTLFFLKIAGTWSDDAYNVPNSINLDVAEFTGVTDTDSYYHFSNDLELL